MGAAATSAAPAFIDTPNMKIESLTPLQKAVWKACQNQVDKNVKNKGFSRLFSCTFPALLRKSLIINGAGEGNRTLAHCFQNAHTVDVPHITKYGFPPLFAIF